MQDLTNIVSISIHLARKNGEYPIMTEKQEAAQRGIIAWKRSNWGHCQKKIDFDDVVAFS